MPECGHGAWGCSQINQGVVRELAWWREGTHPVFHAQDVNPAELVGWQAQLGAVCVHDIWVGLQGKPALPLLASGLRGGRDGRCCGRSCCLGVGSHDEGRRSWVGASDRASGYSWTCWRGLVVECFELAGALVLNVAQVCRGCEGALCRRPPLCCSDALEDCPPNQIMNTSSSTPACPAAAPLPTRIPADLSR